MTKFCARRQDDDDQKNQKMKQGLLLGLEGYGIYFPMFPNRTLACWLLFLMPYAYEILL